ncbi:hypothetical protein LWE61_08040 [Sphingobium sufflavum]|uniref:hypothetical protein n=1 Tax=Sphingobium sufflavum TaxID=1129547 RepID=UPI001F433BC6|nr:hypothetical protein [Sphingobium sufflavum]MCE7796511.1 hypothetical protein [Sphingobium sufflavum]
MLDEIAVVEAEVDALLLDLESADRDARDRARMQIERRHHRLVQLQADILRWNAHADTQTQEAAADMLRQIDQLGIALQDVRLLVNLYDEHAQLMRDTHSAPDQRAEALSGPATPRQLFAISLVRSADKPTAPTRADAWAWLNRQPRYQRSLASDDGWFSWTDPDGHVHRLVDPLTIERKVITLLYKLEGLRGDLGVKDAPETLFATVERGVALMDMVNSLKQDLERFDCEAEARDLEQCKAYAANWRSRRKTT